MVLEDFIQEKFVTPLCHYYTLEATITYGVLLVIAVLGVYKGLQKLKINIDKNFFYGIVPFIIYGGWTRALRDHNLYQGWWWCSPPIYFLIFAIATFSLLLGIYAERKWKIPYWKTMLGIGIILLLYNLTITNVTNVLGFLLIPGFILFWAAVLYGVRIWKPNLLSKTNYFILLSHMMDASSTFSALTFFGYYEQHVLPSFLISMFGPVIMFPLKLIVVWPVLYYIDKDKSSPFFKNFLKLVVLILGLALGIRDWLTVSMI